MKDLGTCDTTPVDYPDFAEAVATAILSEQVERAVLICGSGVGASVAANKFAGIRAGLCHDTYSAHQGVEHDHMNVLVLGGVWSAKNSLTNWSAPLSAPRNRVTRGTFGGSPRSMPSNCDADLSRWANRPTQIEAQPRKTYAPYPLRNAGPGS